MFDNGLCFVFVYRYLFQATRDPTPYFVVPKAIEFYHDLGGMVRKRKTNLMILNKCQDASCKNVNEVGIMQGQLKEIVIDALHYYHCLRLR